MKQKVITDIIPSVLFGASDHLSSSGLEISISQPALY
jgi:hypothetical protein